MTAVPLCGPCAQAGLAVAAVWMRLGLQPCGRVHFSFACADHSALERARPATW